MNRWRFFKFSFEYILHQLLKAWIVEYHPNWWTRHRSIRLSESTSMTATTYLHIKPEHQCLLDKNSFSRHLLISDLNRGTLICVNWPKQRTLPLTRPSINTYTFMPINVMWNGRIKFRCPTSVTALIRDWLVNLLQKYDDCMDLLLHNAKNRYNKNDELFDE